MKIYIVFCAARHGLHTYNLLPTPLLSCWRGGDY